MSTATINKICETLVELLVPILNIEVGQMLRIGDMRHASFHTGSNVEYFEVGVFFVLFDHLFSLVNTHSFGRHWYNLDQENNTKSEFISIYKVIELEEQNDWKYSDK